jgi:hypothetical protein
MIICEACQRPFKNVNGMMQHLEHQRRLGSIEHMIWQKKFEEEAQIKSTKTCVICGKDKPKDCFGRSNSCLDGHRRQCKICMGEKIRKANPERIWAEAAKYKAKSKAKMRDAQLRKDHGITQAQYLELLQRQGGKCAICGATDNGLTRWGTPANFHVDHDHATGVIRGLLCFPCNKGLGMFRDNSEALLHAIEYLRR